MESGSATGRQSCGRPHIIGALALLGLSLASGVAAQYSGSFAAGVDGPIPSREAFEESLAEARWALGPFRFQPWVGLRDASFVSEQRLDGENESTERDLTATAGAGLRAYLPSGKVIVTAQVLPEYVWWQDDSSRRGWNGRYGIGAFGYFNRLRLEISSRLTERQSFFSDEILRLTSTSNQTSRLAVEIDLTRNISVFGFGGSTEAEGDDQDLELFTLLDRRTDQFGAGIKLETSRNLWARVGFETGSTDFAESARNLSNERQAVTVAVGYEGSRLRAGLAITFEDYEPESDSVLEPFSDTTGSLDLTWSPRESVGLGVYASRAFAYALDPASSHLVNERQGLRLDLRRERFNFGLRAGTGQDSFESISATLDRVDDYDEIEARVDFELGKILIVTVNALRRDYDSNRDEFDREVDSFGVGVQLGELIERLRLGSDRSAW